MSSMLAWDHAKISKNSYISNERELLSFQDREFPKLTYTSLSGPNRGYSCRGSTILKSIMLGEEGLDLSLLFSLRVIFLLFDLITGFGCFLVSSYVNLA